MIPRTLRNFNAYVDGFGYAGQIEEIVLPKLTIKTEEYRAGGMDIPVEIDMGMEKMEAELTFTDYNRMLFRLFGLSNGNVVALSLRGVFQGNGLPEPVVINLRGQWREIDMGSWKIGEKTNLKCVLTVRYYKLAINLIQMIEIDAENMIRKIGAADDLRDTRSLLGIISI